MCPTHIAVKPLFDATPGGRTVQGTSVICFVFLTCRPVCFCCVYLSVCLVGSLTVPLKRNRWQLRQKITVVFPFRLAINFFAGIYGNYRHMTRPSSCEATTSFSGSGGSCFVLACEDFGRIFDHSFPHLRFFLKWRLARAH